MLDASPNDIAPLSPYREVKPVRTAWSLHRDPQLAVRELADGLQHAHLGAVLFFCSTEYPLDELA